MNRSLLKPHPSAPHRTGTVALAFVLVLMMVIGASVIAIGRREVNERTQHQHQRWTALLENAIVARRSIGSDNDGPLVLPVGDETEIRITELDSETNSATLYRRETALYSISRPRKP